MPRGNPDKLIPASKRSKQEASELGKKGGIRSGEVRREKKFMSQIYGEMLADTYSVKIDGETKTIEGTALVKAIARDVLMRRDSSSVSMMKEIREATEGNKVKLSGETGGPVEISVIKRVVVDNQVKP